MMMKITLGSAKALSLICATALLWGCQQPASRDRNQPKVVATTAVLCDLAQQIGSDSIDLTCLLQPDQDPHVYTPTPEDRRAVEEAQLVLYGGYDYEPSLIRIVQATQSAAPKLAVYEAAVPTPLLGGAHDHDHGEKAGDDHGHDHAEEKTAAATADADQTPDPHVWHDARNGIAIAQVVTQALSELQPAEASTYQQREQAIVAELQQIQAWIPQQIATIPANQRRLITTHDSFGYYARAYGLTESGAIAGLSTQEQPTPTRLTELVNSLRAAQVPTVFRETTSNPQLIGTVAQEAGVQVSAQPLYVEGPGGADSPAPNYQQMLIHNTCAIATGLGGRCQPPQRQS
ncbi:Mn transporter MntC [Synechococcus elongatus PCC 6311]|uniref:Mn transporter MntC n=3 Tax=Synechococcus elongatus TaxID=32046 RepID=Q31NM3_SYNE7|nr:Mn transporter MntC [Synechococcus elongatus PCC 7942 = FACHB-805]AJD58144.1 Mn transporter MntC [Synechococcus elongatus UTEX 2973]MBD2587753.1 zinc ABC transporter substrate-binding protein [Synechococcus elongatus FACHB-242]MBD2688468.1 zinc ABC transporter substrate-binding protein [Synechococcus elongatus FACHB-1061]UOW71130.1 Mn transporter MntC [Synechococcus elongatus PCC 7943]UOW73851.1 Mn transporter MntC [Synechococcus elongatus PCC 6311]UOW76571.1 Mn transporter MntC [Synechoco